jgi:hypothetical protein
LTGEVSSTREVGVVSDVFELNHQQVVTRFGSLPDGSFMLDFGREEVVNDWGASGKSTLWFGNCLRIVHRYDGGYMNRFECSYLEGSPPDGVITTLDTHEPDQSEGIDVDDAVARVIEHFRNPPSETLRFTPPQEIDLLDKAFHPTESDRTNILATYCEDLVAAVGLAQTEEDRFFIALFGATQLVGWGAGAVKEPDGVFAGLRVLEFPDWWRS